MGMRMSPENYFEYSENDSPPLFYEVPRRCEAVKPLHHTVIAPGIGECRHAAGVPVPVDHTAIILGVVAIVAIVVLGLAFLSRK